MKLLLWKIIYRIMLVIAAYEFLAKDIKSFQTRNGNYIGQQIHDPQRRNIRMIFVYRDI